VDFSGDGFSAEELAFLLGFAEQMSEEERQRLRSLQDDGPVVPDPDAPEWFEED